MITDISQCSSVDKLVTLDVAKNEIEDASSFAFLRTCKRLRSLNVAGNRFYDYRDLMTRLLPQLKILDGEDIAAASKSVDRLKRADSELPKNLSPNANEPSHQVPSIPKNQNDDDFSPEENKAPRSQRRTPETESVSSHE
ncbi:uncharacterized protein [Venturia canescens]|uniref:uncharacterized protein n=1 Tax=Venturia canescens TaxID=32260 RepID=UPI001C9CA263|nr:uncharacterized protein LOC122406148 [Venturia canescens]